MTNEQNSGISRRAFLGLGATAAAVAGLAGCAPQTPVESAAGGETLSQTGGMPMADNGASAGPDTQGLHSWEIAPEPIPADEITATEDTDVLVIGAGLGAGHRPRCAYRRLPHQSPG